MKLNRLLIPLFAVAPLLAMGQKKYHLSYRIGTEATFSNEDNAPYWLTANKFGLGGTEKNNFYFRAGADWYKSYRHGWKLAGFVGNSRNPLLSRNNKPGRKDWLRRQR